MEALSLRRRTTSKRMIRSVASVRAFLDQPLTLPSVAAVFATVHVLLVLTGFISAEHLAGGLVLALALALAAFLPALAPSLVVLGAVAQGGLLEVMGISLEVVLVGAVVFWETVRRVGPWTRSFTLVGGLLLAGIGGVVVAVQPTLVSIPSELFGNVEFFVRVVAGLIVTLLLSGMQVVVFVLGRRAPVGRDDRVNAVMIRAAGPQDMFSVGVKGGQAVVLLAIVSLPYLGIENAPYLLIAAVFSIAFVLHQRSPLLALGIAWFAAILQMGMLLAPSPANLVITTVLFSCGASESGRIRLAGAISVVVGSLAASLYLVMPPVAGSSDKNILDQPIVVVALTCGGFLIAFGFCWTIGLLSRAVRRVREGNARQLAAEKERARAQRELDAVEERNRIARDMHDVVAHSLAVVIAQADGARYLGVASPEQTDAALMTISSVARDALADVRVLLAQLRHRQGEAPQPEARELTRLLDSIAGTGVVVRSDLAVEMDSVPRATGIALYRIVQEATTNALRHGRPGAPLDVTLRCEAERLVLTVRNSRHENPLSAPGTGHGLIGMRERAALVGGDLTAGPEGGDFVVEARLPATPHTASVPTQALVTDLLPEDRGTEGIAASAFLAADSESARTTPIDSGAR
ncbi:sensor histidine kinase [Rathayibacter toxicus]|nr:sensor histidine kinase [Rathayibacter toxicus]PPG46554.1 sensor histidine kinase [Rathayibacter toxicus]PPH63439.1 sensor histidine kinase [Rathayibacter toxicus]PPH67781.1 sensor histidine kinase [Rathayibacter toxicus]PPH72583.1 sensor histidine kinase [Rathayibacter toxicus]